LLDDKHQSSLPETFLAQFCEVLGISGENRYFDTYEVGLKIGIANPYLSTDAPGYFFARSQSKSRFLWKKSFEK
jgi:hypothetical protein